MNSSGGRGGYDQIPSCLENPRWAERLPESDIEFTSRRPAAEQAGHRHALTHEVIIECFTVVRNRVT